MKYDLFVATLVLRETETDYEILLCDTGAGWSLPLGPVGVTEGMDDLDGESEALVSCFTHLADQTNIGPALIEDGDMLQSKLWFVSNEEDSRQLCLVYYSFVDPTKSAELEKALEEKMGNVRFCKYDHADPSTFPDLIDDWMEEAIVYQMQYFNKRQN